MPLIALTKGNRALFSTSVEIGYSRLQELKMQSLVTGGSTGLGFETALALGKAGHDVSITTRHQYRGEAVVEKLSALYPKQRFDWFELDLAKGSSLNSFANRYLAAHSKFDLLILNAGAKILPNFDRTDYGVEYHFGVNAVGHFAIAMDLLPHRNPGARVVSVASIVARIANPKIGPQGSPDKYSPAQSYAASKLANLLFAIELGERIGEPNFSVAAHPGFARAEPYGSAMTTFFESFLAQSAADGAKPIVQAALAATPSIYTGPSILELWGEPANAKIPRLVTSDNLKRNWQILCELAGRELLI